MDSGFVFYLLLGAAAGGFINGFAGTGTALFAIGFFLVALEPLAAVAVVALISVLTGLQGLWVVREAIVTNRGKLLGFIVPGLIGVPVGVSLLERVDAGSLRLLVAALLVAYGGYFGFRSALPKRDSSTPGSDICIGFAGGVLGGLASLSGALPSIWLSMRAAPKVQIRAVLQSYNVAILFCTVVMLLLKGAYTSQTWVALGIALPAGLLFSQLGIFLFKKLSDEQFRRTLIMLCLCLGLGMFMREWLY
jgi:uncharacterized membrane protein YfcA